MKWTREDLDAAMVKIEELASTDMDFRNLCLSDPHAAVKKATGKDVEPSYKLKFLENEAGYETFVLPDYQGSGDELSDADLDSVAGGGTKWDIG
ncbi:MAG: hypothetical protein VR72_02720 [Clostridiaceae bacterium BRH_c20a]|nr:MAG: hypothetical protein VR72_02720 [Clostridiaceae bacterium BRH_c20a]